MEIAGVGVTLLDGVTRVTDVEGRAGTARLAIAETPDLSVLRIGLCTWDDGGRDLRTLSVETHWPEYERLLHGMRIGVHDAGLDQSHVELTTIGVTTQGSVAALQASEEVLDNLVGESVRTILSEHGAQEIGTKEELFGVKHGRRRYLAMLCGSDNQEALFAAYVICRILPITNLLMAGDRWPKSGQPTPTAPRAAPPVPATSRRELTEVSREISEFESSAWLEYRQWNDAVAAICFPELDEPLPVYLDLEDHVLTAIAELAGFSGDPRDGLSQAVRGVTVKGQRFSLDKLLRFQRIWAKSKAFADQPPPCLAFLALSVLAAEDMGTAEDDISPIAYYPRLASLLQLPAGSHSVHDEYPRRAEYLWHSLNRWLDDYDGKRGTPTAYALSRRFVGLPLSQALVREGDRRKFPGFFAQYGLAPGMDVAPEVVERYLDAWFGSESCPASAPLRKQWSKPAARERIAAVAAVELAGWDGTLPQGTAAEAIQIQRIGLMAQLRQGFMGSSLDLSLTLRQMGLDNSAGCLEVEVGHDEWLPLNFQPGAGNLWRTSHSEGVDMASVLEGVVKLRTGNAQGEVLKHFPRTIVPLVLDELQAAFLEQERLQLNVDSILLVRRVARNQAIADRVVKILETCARPGFTIHEEYPGLPDGWVLITDVQLFGAPSDTRFNELVPLARDQLTIAGGLRIPSRIRKWSSLAAPEVRASVESESNLRIILTNMESDVEIGQWESDDGALVVPLQELALEDGDYRAALYAGKSKNPLQQVTIRLRSGDSVDSGWNLVTRLSYFIAAHTGSLGALTASEADSASLPIVVDGALTIGCQDIEATELARATIQWGKPKPEGPPPAKVEIGAPDESSCVSTGAHYLEYPPFFGGRQPRFIEGVCRYCGLVKRSPGWIRPAWRGRVAQSTSTVDVSHLAPVSSDSDTKWGAAMDALMHLGGGAPGSLLGIASQIDGSSLFASRFPRTVEALGHVSIAREMDGTVTGWEIAPAYLAESSTGEWHLVGFWPPNAVNTLDDRVRDRGGALVVETAAGAPPRKFLTAVTEDVVNDCAADLATCVPAAGMAMLEALPRLSWVEQSLPRMPMPGYSAAQRFDTRSASWVATGDVSSPGAYRLKRGFETIDAFRTTMDVSRGTYASVDVYLSKHLAARHDGISLITYFPDRQSLAVPRGADLPGLYARALVQMSGTLPREGRLTVQERKRDCLTYDAVDQTAADLLVTLLTS